MSTTTALDVAKRLAPPTPVTRLATSWPVMEAKRWAGAAFGVVAVQPLATLYLEGPTMLGMWGGAPPETICAQLTEVPADHWTRTTDNYADCADTIHRHFNSWLVLGGSIVYFGAMAAVAYHLCCRWGWGRRPSPPPPQVVIVRQAFPNPPATKSSFE